MKIEKVKIWVKHYLVSVRVVTPYIYLKYCIYYTPINFHYIVSEMFIIRTYILY